MDGSQILDVGCICKIKKKTHPLVAKKKICHLLSHYHLQQYPVFIMNAVLRYADTSTKQASTPPDICICICQASKTLSPTLMSPYLLSPPSGVTMTCTRVHQLSRKLCSRPYFLVAKCMLASSTTPTPWFIHNLRE